MGLAPAIRRAATLGKDEQAPAFVEQGSGQVGRLAIHPLALDRDGVDGERKQDGLPTGVEEIVGPGGDNRAVPPALRQQAQQERRVDVTGVVGGKDEGLVEVSQPVEPGYTVGDSSGPSRSAGVPIANMT